MISLGSNVQITVLFAELGLIEQAPCMTLMEFLTMTSLDVLRTMSGIIFIIGILATLNGTILMRQPRMFGRLNRTLITLLLASMQFMTMEDWDLEIIHVDMEQIVLFQCIMEMTMILMNGRPLIMQSLDILIIRVGGLI